MTNKELEKKVKELEANVLALNERLEHLIRELKQVVPVIQGPRFRR